MKNIYLDFVPHISESLNVYAKLNINFFLICYLILCNKK